MTALILEREEDILELLSYNLAKAGYQVISLDSESDFLTTVATTQPDLVLIGNVGGSSTQRDWCMQAGMIPGSLHRRIVCLTTDEKDCKDLSSQDSVDACILTPITPKKLMHSLNQILPLETLI